MTDVEGASVGGGSSSRQQRQAVVDNPFSNHPEALTQKRFIDKVQRILYIIISAYALHYFKFYGVILRSPHVRHEWFKIGLAFTIGEYTLRFVVWLVSPLTNSVRQRTSLYSYDVCISSHCTFFLRNMSSNLMNSTHSSNTDNQSLH